MFQQPSNSASAKTDAFIRTLSRSLPRPARSLPRTRLTLLATIALVFGLTLLVLGLREDWEQNHTHPVFLAHSVGWVSLILLGGWGTIYLMAPRWPLPALSKFLFSVTGILAAGLVLPLLWHGLHPQHLVNAEFAETCAVIVTSSSLLVGLGMYVLSRRATPTYPLLMAALASAVSGAVGMLTVSFVCPVQDEGHILLSHLLPGLLSTFGILLAGQRWCRW